MGIVYIPSRLGRGLWQASRVPVNTNPGPTYPPGGRRGETDNQIPLGKKPFIQYDRAETGGMQSVWKVLLGLLLALALAEPHNGPVELTKDNFYKVRAFEGSLLVNRAMCGPG